MVTYEPSKILGGDKFNFSDEKMALFGLLWVFACLWVGLGGMGGGGVSEEGTRHPRKIGHSEVRGAVREQTNENL